MSQENIDILQRAIAHFDATGEHLTEIYAPEFVCDMSNYPGWPEQAIYEGIEGLRRFLDDWGRVFDWEYEVESIHDAGEYVVFVARMKGGGRRPDWSSRGLLVTCGLCAMARSRAWRSTRTPPRRCAMRACQSPLCLRANRPRRARARALCPAGTLRHRRARGPGRRTPRARRAGQRRAARRRACGSA